MIPQVLRTHPSVVSRTPRTPRFIGETVLYPLTVTSRGLLGVEIGCLSLKNGVRCEREFWKGENVSVGPCGGGGKEIRSHRALEGLNFVHARSEMGYIVI